MKEKDLESKLYAIKIGSKTILMPESWKQMVMRAGIPETAFAEVSRLRDGLEVDTIILDEALPYGQLSMLEPKPTKDVLDEPLSLRMRKWRKDG